MSSLSGSLVELSVNVVLKLSPTKIGNVVGIKSSDMVVRTLTTPSKLAGLFIGGGTSMALLSNRNL